MTYRIPSAPINTDVFPAFYGPARHAWLEQLDSLTLPVEHAYFPCQGGGPDGELLVTDVAWLGPSSATKVLVLIGGTHGIEGFAGSAVQLDCLRLLSEEAFTLPNDTAILLVHALNPWGYAWLRRCDEDGVDLNRNFVDFKQALPVNEGYQAARALFFIEDLKERSRQLAQRQLEVGRIVFEMAVSGGQYQDPAGPFYGGVKPAHGRIVTEHIISKFALRTKDLAVIDVHTGLGQYGYGEIICDHAPDSAGTAIAHNWYGASVTSPALGTSSSVPKTGLLDYAWHDVMNDQSCYITLEFGTFSTDCLINVLLDDHRIWSQHDPLSAHQLHGLHMRKHFCPNDSAWQEMLLFRARQVIAQALAGVSA